MSDSKISVSINDFVTGQVLTGDIVDHQDKILFRKGLKLTQEIISAWQRRGQGPFYLSGAGSESNIADSQADGSQKAHQYSPDHIQRVERWFDAMVDRLNELVQAVIDDQLPTLNDVESSVEAYLDLMECDLAVIAHCVLHRTPKPEKPLGHIHRSVCMSALSGITGYAYGLDRQECSRICLAALLHDLALYPAILDKIRDSFEREEERHDVVYRHGFFSSDLLGARTGLSNVIRVVMQQVHEQSDGSGYPRGIPGHVINVMARIINVVDAFLNLVGIESDEPGYLPADAIAYMVHHTIRGAFDRESMMSFIRTVSMYGIGSRVELDNGDIAVVLRTIDGNSMRPVVRIESPNDSTPQIINLVEVSTNIAQPLEDSKRSLRGRLPKAKMDSILWQRHGSIKHSESSGELLYSR